MEHYNPLQGPDPDEWAALDESEQISLVEEYHFISQVEFQEGAETVHAVIHVIVENQIAMDVKPVPETIARLMRQGLDRHEAIHAVGAILCEDLYDMTASAGSWNAKRYRRRLEKLTAKRWRKGKW